MNIKKIAVCVIALIMFAATGCKDKSEVVCKNGMCVPAIGKKQIVEIDAPAYKKLPQLSEKDEPVNQEFTPIRESQLESHGLMTMAGQGGQFNEITLNEVEIPGVDNAEAAISGDMEYIEREYKDNLWPGGVEQSAEMDFDEF